MKHRAALQRISGKNKHIAIKVVNDRVMDAADGILTFITLFLINLVSNMGLVFRLLVNFFICTDVGISST